MGWAGCHVLGSPVESRWIYQVQPDGEASWLLAMPELPWQPPFQGSSSEMHGIYGMVPDPRFMNQSPQESEKAAHHAEHWSQCIIVVSELTVFAPVFWSFGLNLGDFCSSRLGTLMKS